MVNREDLRTFAFLPVTVHLETQGGLATPLILRGTPLPSERVESFSTASDDQDTVEVKVLMGESRLAAKDLAVGTLRLTGIPPAPRGKPKILVRFKVDRSCIVTVTAEIGGTPIKAEQSFSPPTELSEEAIARIVSEAHTAKGDDDPAVAKIEATIRAEGLIASAETRLREAGSADLSRAVADLGLAIQTGEGADIRSKADRLDRLLNPTFDADLFSTFFGGARPAATPSAPGRQASTSKVTHGSAPVKRQAVSATNLTPPVLGRVFGNGTFTLDPKLCFVLMPFDEKHRPVYDDHIKPTVESAGLRCQRADEVAGVVNITWDIWERINSARLVVADLTDRNANVFYEVGLAHAISKDVILLTQSMDFVPFDLRSVRCIQYEYTPRGTRNLEAKLRSTIDAVMRREHT